MGRYDDHLTLSDRGDEPFVATSVASDSELANGGSDDDGIPWGDVIDSHLIDWMRDPERLAADDFDPPTPVAISAAAEMVRRLRVGSPGPHLVAPDGDGGIALERRDGETLSRIGVDERGHVEFLFFHGARLVWRRPLDAE